MWVRVSEVEAVNLAECWQLAVERDPYYGCWRLVARDRENAPLTVAQAETEAEAVAVLGRLCDALAAIDARREKDCARVSAALEACRWLLRYQEYCEARERGDRARMRELLTLFGLEKHEGEYNPFYLRALECAHLAVAGGKRDA